jgi:hypothetical protein
MNTFNTNKIKQMDADWYFESLWGEKIIPKIKENKRVKYKYIKKVFQFTTLSMAIDS